MTDFSCRLWCGQCCHRLSRCREIGGRDLADHGAGLLATRLPNADARLVKWLARDGFQGIRPRVQFNGRAPAVTADHAGAIPVTRSTNWPLERVTRLAGRPAGPTDPVTQILISPLMCSPSCWWAVQLGAQRVGRYASGQPQARALSSLRSVALHSRLPPLTASTAPVMKDDSSLAR